MWSNLDIKFRAIIGDIKAIISSELLTVLIILLVATLSFGLGRLSSIQKSPIIVRENHKEASSPDIKVGNEQNLANVANAFNSSTKTVVASKNSNKYHYLSCPGAKTISEANKIYFNSEIEAQKAGYTKALNCN